MKAQFFLGPNKANESNKAKGANRASNGDQKIFIIDNNLICLVRNSVCVVHLVHRAVR